MESLPGKKGYSDPVLDIEHSMLVLERPVECLNLRSHDVAPDRSGLIPRGPTEELIPYRWYQESWSWEKVAPLCDAVKCLRWKFQPQIGEVIVKGNANQNNQGWHCYVYSHPSEGWWGVIFYWFADPQNAKTANLLTLVPKAFDSILRTAGLSEWVTVEHGPLGYCTWHVKPSQGRMPHHLLWIQTEAPQGSYMGNPRNPASEGITPNAISEVHLQHLSFEMLDRIFRDLIVTMAPKGSDIRQMKFQPLDTEIPAFREWAQPRFGGPWLQEIAGWAIKTPSPEDIDDNLPDWTLLPVAHFKILGSWRIVTVVKEPGGWRFHVTGKYTKDPLKHRHIRDELARKAGMTSETLWEPQEVGEGWLGVPG